MLVVSDGTKVSNGMLVDMSSVGVCRRMSSTQQIEHHDDDDNRQITDSAAAGMSDNEGFLVPSPIPTRRTRTYSQYVANIDDQLMMMMMKH